MRKEEREIERDRERGGVQQRDENAAWLLIAVLTGLVF